jgi:hypothetical protein
MKADYPAAQSMDTTWFAVDRDGHVGVFISNENGAVPSVLQDANPDEMFELLTGPDGEMLFDFNLIREEAARRGIFSYEYDDLSEIPFQAGYPRARRPETPLHVDQMPPRLRNLAKKIRLDRVSFPNADRVQPVEHFECMVWGGEEEVAYLAADGVTVRPIPGREDRFAAFCEEVRRDMPDLAEHLRFEGADES